MAKLQKCIFCGCIMVECITEEEAIEAFNNRVNEAKIRAKAYDEFLKEATRRISDMILNHQKQLDFANHILDELAEQLGGE